jgi:hypothetical protein
MALASWRGGMLSACGFTRAIDTIARLRAQHVTTFERANLLRFLQCKCSQARSLQSAAVFPFIGYFALINDKTTSLFNHPEGLKGLFWFSPQSELFLVYFGLFLIGTGVVVYNLRCPFLIKHFRDENECAQFYMQMVLGQVWAMLGNVFGLAKANKLKENGRAIVTRPLRT